MADERKRAALFDDDEPVVAKPKLNLDRFAPKKPPEVDAKVVETVSKEAGFTTSHAPKEPETPEPPKMDGRRLKKSNRTTQFNVRLKPQNAERFWAGAEREGYEYADDFLAHLLKLYEEGRGIS
jgi:hypothetical protein